MKLTSAVLFAGVLSLSAVTSEAQTSFSSLVIKNGANSVTINPPASGTPTFTFPSTSGEVLVNPMSALGDLMYGGASGAPTRLAASAANANKVLQSNGLAAPTWVDALTGLTGITLANGADRAITVSTNTTAAGDDLTLQAGTTTFTDAQGGAVNLTGGNSNGTAAGGGIVLTGGVAGANAAGGDIQLTGGVGGATTGNGGAVTISGGDAGAAGAGGYVRIEGGAASSGNGGNIFITASNAAVSGDGGSVDISSGATVGGTNGAVLINSSNSRPVTIGNGGTFTLNSANIDISGGAITGATGLTASSTTDAITGTSTGTADNNYGVKGVLNGTLGAVRTQYAVWGQTTSTADANAVKQIAVRAQGNGSTDDATTNVALNVVHGEITVGRQATAAADNGGLNQIVEDDGTTTSTHGPSGVVDLGVLAAPAGNLVTTTTLTVNNVYAKASSLILCTILNGDGIDETDETASVTVESRAAGSFVIRVSRNASNVAPTGDWTPRVGFLIINADK